MNSRGAPNLLIDARCLQHPDFATRGIGQHLASMLDTPEAREFTITLLFDPDLPAPAGALAKPGDQATTTPYQASRTRGLFLQPAPFSFPPANITRLLHAPAITSIAIIHDFIPLDRPDLYLTTQAQRRAYQANLAALRLYDWFLPNSSSTANRLQTLFPPSQNRTTITGVAIRPTLIHPIPPGFPSRTTILAIVGDDPRKNPEIILQAALAAPIRLIGIHDPSHRARLAALHQSHGGDPNNLIFEPRLDDATLAARYAHARLVIAPSLNEGFSMPIIEAIANQTPVLAADNPAQAELIDPIDRFAPDNPAELHVKATNLLTNQAAWHEAQSRQSTRHAMFTQTTVAARFWAPIQALTPHPTPTVGRHHRPRIAFLSPLPPAASGCADHSAALLPHLANHADITAFSDHPPTTLPPPVRFGGPATPTIMRSRIFDAIITILGNSPFHFTETRLLLDHGAAAILHDSRLSGFYRGGLGINRALAVASGESGRDITLAELQAWDDDQTAMPIRFLGDIAAAASPLIVHAAETARYLTTQHDRTARFIPFAPYRLPHPAALGARGRLAARRRLAIPPGTALIASFGAILPGKEPTRLLEAFARLATTRPSCLALVGAASAPLTAALRQTAATLDLPPASLILHETQVPESTYRDYLAAADAAIQLRRAPAGSISGALADIAAAGLACVASATLVAALAPPPYILSVADEAGPATIAAALQAALIVDRDHVTTQRRRFIEQRSMARYADEVFAAVMR